MQIQPLIQSSIIEISEWQTDAEFGVFPQGARAKDAVFAPSTQIDNCLIPNKRYLFKRSKKSYPDQFWGEIIAYRVGCFLGLPVPPAFVAFNSRTGHSAALIEWFYSDGKEAFILGGDLLQNIQDDFDRKYGQQHNIHHITVLMRMLSKAKLLKENWREWWISALIFDALIGNTDRHQDNWGIIVSNGSVVLSPLFDNGTSLGHELFPVKTQSWDDQRYEKYLNNGKHHVKWSLNEPYINGHKALLEKIFEEWPETKDLACNLLNFNFNHLSDNLMELLNLNAQIPLTHERMSLVLSLLNRRHMFLKSLF